jgi:hypothetical protein
MERRLQDSVHDRFGEHVGDPHHQAQRPPAGASLHRVHELAAQREDLVGVPIRHPPGVGQDQIPALSVEQLLAEDVLQAMDLAADGGMSETQLLAGPDDAPLLGDGPEVEKVMIVEPFHLQDHTSIFSTARRECSRSA